MIFALLILLVATTLAAIWHGRSQYAVLFGVSAFATALVLVVDIDTPLTLVF
jgi:hypothetical protein